MPGDVSGEEHREQEEQGEEEEDLGARGSRRRALSLH